MNKLLAFIQRRIPYLPELKSYCGSIEATILMQQLEYWFSGKPDGFYKFLKPCSHSKYREGDSWVEELQFTEHEFRTGFDRIGTRYKSKTQFQDTLNRGVDIFEGKYYASYVDIRNNLTYYIRNHEAMDNLLTQVLSHFTPTPQGSTGSTTQTPVNPESAFTDMNEMEPFGMSTIPVNADLSFTGMQVPHSRESTSSIHMNSVSPFPNKEAKKNSKEEPTKMTAEAGRCSPKPAAALSFNNLNQDSVIGEVLTNNQEALIKRAIDAMSIDLGATPESLFNEITFTLLSPKHFKQAGNDFYKKMNTILKQIKTSRWTTPAELIVESQKAQVRINLDMHIKRREIEGAIGHWEKMLSIAKANSNFELITLYQNEIKSCQEQRRQLTTAEPQEDAEVAALTPSSIAHVKHMTRINNKKVDVCDRF